MDSLAAGVGLGAGSGVGFGAGVQPVVARIAARVKELMQVGISFEVGFGVVVRVVMASRGPFLTESEDVD